MRTVLTVCVFALIVSVVVKFAPSVRWAAYISFALGMFFDLVINEVDKFNKK